MNRTRRRRMLKKAFTAQRRAIHEGRLTLAQLHNMIWRRR